MTKYLKVQDPFDRNRKVKALRPTVRMGGTTTRNGKEVNVGMSKHWMAKERALDRMKSTGKGGSQKKLNAYNRKVDAKDEWEK